MRLGMGAGRIAVGPGIALDWSAGPAPGCVCRSGRGPDPKRVPRAFFAELRPAWPAICPGLRLRADATEAGASPGMDKYLTTAGG